MRRGLRGGWRRLSTKLGILVLSMGLVASTGASTVTVASAKDVYSMTNPAMGEKDPALKAVSYTHLTLPTTPYV